MTQWLLDQGSHYGYIVVFAGVLIETLGIPFPGETAILVGAVLAGSGRLNAVAVGVVAWTAAVVGPTISYAIFRRYGQRLLNLRVIRRFYKPAHVLRAEKFFAERGWMGVVLTRFVVVLRMFTGPLAGLHSMPPGAFMAANAAGAALWVTAVVVVGLLIGSHLDRAVSLLSTWGLWGLGAVVTAAAVGLAIRWVLHRRLRAKWDLH